MGARWASSPPRRPCYAQERDLDLVEVAAEARPPVVRVLDYSKYKYEQEQKAKAARKHQKQVTVREIKLRPKIASNDYETKKSRGERLLMQLADDVSEFGIVEQRPNLDGRNMTMLLAPVKPKEAAAERPEAAEAPAAESPEAAEAPAPPEPPAAADED